MRRDDVLEAGEGKGKHGVELDAGVPLLEVAPPHPAVHDADLDPLEQPRGIPPQDVPVAQPRQPPPAAPGEIALPLHLLGVYPVGGVDGGAAHVEGRGGGGL